MPAAPARPPAPGPRTLTRAFYPAARYLLASLHFPSVAARVPAAMSTVYVALIGSGMGVAWRYKPLPEVPFNPILRDRIQRRCPGDKCSTEKS